MWNLQLGQQDLHERCLVLVLVEIPVEFKLNWFLAYWLNWFECCIFAHIFTEPFFTAFWCMSLKDRVGAFTKEGEIRPSPQITCKHTLRRQSPVPFAEPLIEFCRLRKTLTSRRMVTGPIASPTHNRHSEIHHSRSF